MTVTMDTQIWAEEQFGQCDLKDKRRTRRLVQLAASVLCHPSGSLPEQTADMADLKAAYRLFACEDVKFEDIAGPHWEQTRRRPPGTYLVLDDTTELDFGIRRRFAAWGGRETAEVGVSCCIRRWWSARKTRDFRPGGTEDSLSQANTEKGEHGTTAETGSGIGTVGAGDRSGGPPAEGVRWVHVMDRGADNFEVYCHCREQHRNGSCVPRRRTRCIVPEGRTDAIKRISKTLALAGEYELQLRATGAQPERGTRRRGSAAGANGEGGGSFRAAEDAVSRAQESLSEAISPIPIAMWVVHAVEVDAPKDAERVEWILLTSLPVKSFEDAWRVLGYYEKRWLIEEWHKALKTGCRVEADN